MLRHSLLALTIAVTACRGGGGPKTPASEGVRAYLAALRNPDPHAAYGMLSADARRATSFDQFALEWKETKAEREWQAKQLEESLKGNPDVGERAVVSYSDGKVAQLEREGKQWRLENELFARSHAKRPRDAVRLFAEAIEQRDVGRILTILTQRRRDGIQKQVEGFINGIGKHINSPVEESGDKSELRWDENGIRYRIVLRKEDEEWRIDDIYVRPAPKEEPTSGDGIIDDE